MTYHQWIPWALTLGAVLRVTRLIVDDTITRPLRTATGNRASQRVWAFLNGLITCTWCTSIWVSAAAAVLFWAWGHTGWYLYVAAALTLSWLTGIAQSWLDSPPPRKFVSLDLGPVRLTDDRTQRTPEV